MAGCRLWRAELFLTGISGGKKSAPATKNQNFPEIFEFLSNIANKYFLDTIEVVKENTFYIRNLPPH